MLNAQYLIEDGVGIDDAGNASGVVSYYFDVKIFNINSQLKVVVKSANAENLFCIYYLIPLFCGVVGSVTAVNIKRNVWGQTASCAPSSPACS